MPEEAVQAVLDMDGQLLVPIHWGMFTLSMHDWFEPPVRVLAEQQDWMWRVLTPLLGQLVDVSDMPENHEWWEQVNLAPSLQPGAGSVSHDNSVVGYLACFWIFLSRSESIPTTPRTKMFDSLEIGELIFCHRNDVTIR